MDALSQRNAYKPTKEPINYREPSGYRTQYPQTEATLPVASCPARSFHATEIVSKTQSEWYARSGTGQLTTHLEYTCYLNTWIAPWLYKYTCLYIHKYTYILHTSHVNIYIYIYIYMGCIKWYLLSPTNINPSSDSDTFDTCFLSTRLPWDKHNILKLQWCESWSLGMDK